MGNLEGDVPGSGVKITAVMAAAVALALLVALIPGRMGQFLRLGLRNSLRVSSMLLRISSLNCSLDNFLV